VDPLLPDLRYAGACMTRLGDLARDLVARSESLDGLLRHLLGKRPRVTRAHVVWAYRLLLDREPETEAAIRQKLGIWATTRDLRAAFMSSPEFQNLNPGLGLSMEPTVVIKELEPGLRLFVDLSDVFIGHGILRGEYERAERALVARTARSGMTVLDVGAHIGYFTVLMARLVGATGRVHAFEPLDSVATLLERSIRENRFEDRVCLARVAVGDGSGTRQLVFASRTLNSGGAYLAGPDGSVPAGHEERDVPVVALDDYPLRRPVAFIKVDVEGAEPLVFRGAERLLREDRPVVLAEVHPGQLERVCGLTPADVVAEMEGRGYECRDLDGGRVVRRVDRVRSVVFAPRERDSQA
jgi:FkbM family methyltransferase